MHPADTQWWRTHSADYVLGLLSNAERLVFERIMPTEPELQEFVIDWRETLQPMSDAIPPIQPPEHILPSLISNIPVASQNEFVEQDFDATQDNSALSSTALVVAGSAAQSISETDAADDQYHAQSVNQSNSQPDDNHHYPSASAEDLVDGTAFMRLLESKQAATDSWRGFAGLATAACLLTGIVGWMGFQNAQTTQAEPTYDSVSVLQNIAAQAIWVVDSSADTKTLRVTAVAPPALEQGQAYELWMVKADDSVVSMGLLPTQAQVSSQINAQRFSAEADSFSVSVESVSGSPEPIPTGPVLYRGKIQALSN